MRKPIMMMIIIGLVINGSNAYAATEANPKVKLPMSIQNVIERRTEVEQRYSYQIELLQKQSLDNFKNQVNISKANIEKSMTVEGALAKAGLKTQFAGLYQKASEKYGVPWQIIAAVHVTETHQSGTAVVTSYAGAQGPMQFMPATFAHYAQDGDGDRIPQINNVQDAVFSAANYLKANGAAQGRITNALFCYNHSMAYVNHVLGIAQSLGF